MYISTTQTLLLRRRTLERLLRDRSSAHFSWRLGAPRVPLFLSEASEVLGTYYIYLLFTHPHLHNTLPTHLRLEVSETGQASHCCWTLSARDVKDRLADKENSRPSGTGCASLYSGGTTRRSHSESAGRTGQNSLLQLNIYHGSTQCAIRLGQRAPSRRTPRPDNPTHQRRPRRTLGLQRCMSVMGKCSVAISTVALPGDRFFPGLCSFGPAHCSIDPDAGHQLPLSTGFPRD